MKLDKYLLGECALLVRFSRSEVKGCLIIIVCEVYYYNSYSHQLCQSRINMAGGLGSAWSYPAGPGKPQLPNALHFT